MAISLNTNSGSIHTQALTSMVGQEIKDVVDCIQKVIGLVQGITALCQGTAQECQKLDINKLKINELSLIPNCVERGIGNRYLDQLCPPDLRVRDVTVDQIAKEILPHCDQNKVTPEVYLKRDEMINAHALPGGKVVITTGLLAKLRAEGSEEEVKQKLASVISYLLATTEESQGVKAAQFEILLLTVGKLAEVAIDQLMPKTDDARTKATVDTIRKRFGTLTTLGGKIALENQRSGAEDLSKVRGAELAKAAGYAGDLSCLKSLFGEARTQDPKEDLRRELRYLLADISMLV